ncbi:hypothetical protein N4P33_28130 [Streptomyces sp. 15-116A]|uniref:hypothetical protein n=1 Tax=Streptomyces sp. 15-116A TaxID=2259035 RepID=UPI0021B4C1CE|nr:hypothetical protein [Streptomyces sp. 15-116A]MCT7355991.1 hypothetical protein [Streptomyces sp. 15-116A]
MVELVQESLRIHGGSHEDDADYHFTLAYTASFDPGEMADTFTEFMRLREEDGGLTLEDDHLTASSPASGTTFVPNNVPGRRPDNRPGHQGMTLVDRTISVDLPREVADTEGGIHDAGHEEIYGEIWLRSSGNLSSTAPEGSDSGLGTTNIGDFDP